MSASALPPLVRLAIVLAVVASAIGTAPRAPQDRNAAASPPRARPVAWTEAEPIVKRLEDALPQSLRDIPSAERAARWPAWVAARRQEIAQRVAQGDEDSVVNLLLFGTSFTSQPRLTAKLLRELDERWKAGDRSVQEVLARHYQQRATDLVAAAANPRAGERMLDVRRVLAAHGHDVATAAGRESAMAYLFASLARVREEAAKLASELEATRRAPDATAGYAERSRIFRDRGLAGDSSVLTQFAVDRAICGLRDRGLLSPRSIRHVAIVGPGLDFADKQEGFDFYPPQSLQPFTAVDSLLSCGMAVRGELRVTTIDVSPRVNAHLRAAVSRATTQQTPYRLVFPWSTDTGSTPEAEAYWKRAGDLIGKPFTVAAAAPPGVRARGLAVAPDVVRAIRPVEASIVSDRLELGATDRFDLVLASNVLLYYDTFEQTLALASIASMVRPGGVLLTNDAVLEVPEVPMRSDGYVTVAFSDRAGDGERMVYYVRAGDGR